MTVSSSAETAFWPFPAARSRTAPAATAPARFEAVERTLRNRAFHDHLAAGAGWGQVHALLSSATEHIVAITFACGSVLRVADVPAHSNVVLHAYGMDVVSAHYNVILGQRTTLHLTAEPPPLESMRECIYTFVHRPSRIEAEKVSIEPLPATTLSATSPELELRDVLTPRVVFAFAAALDERFEDGKESEFSRTVLSLVAAHGTAAVSSIESAMDARSANPGIVAETLLWLGAADHAESYKYRLYVIQKHLGSRSALVRDAAGLALARMDDPDVIPALQVAIAGERLPEVREGLQLVLEQLEQTLQCRRT